MRAALGAKNELDDLFATGVGTPVEMANVCLGAMGCVCENVSPPREYGYTAAGKSLISSVRIYAPAKGLVLTHVIVPDPKGRNRGKADASGEDRLFLSWEGNFPNPFGVGDPVDLRQVLADQVASPAPRKAVGKLFVRTEVKPWFVQVYVPPSCPCNRCHFFLL